MHPSQSFASKIATAWATTTGKIILIGSTALILGGSIFGIYRISDANTNKTAGIMTPTTSNIPPQTSSPSNQQSTPKNSSSKPTAQSPTKPGEAPKTSQPTNNNTSTGQGTNNSSAPTPSGNTGGTGNTGGPAAFKANCINTPSSCGYPDATNTGVPSGVSLTNSGSITVTQNGAVIDGRNVTGQIIVRANNVTIRNTRITSADYYPIDYDGHTGLLVQDTEIYGLNTNVTAGISFRDYTARRVYIHGTVDGLKADANVLIEDSYVTGLRYDAVNDSHNDGVQTTGGSNVTLRHNTFKMSDNPNVSAVIQIGTEWGSNTNWLVTDNLIDGGGWSINSGASNATMKFTNNRFTRNAGYGPGHTSGMTWTGNYYDNDGTVVP